MSTGNGGLRRRFYGEAGKTGRTVDDTVDEEDVRKR